MYSDTRIDIDSLPYPDYSDFDLTKYWGKNSVCAEISRGCIAKCSYCTEVYYWKFRDRGSKTVLDELEYQVNRYGISHVSFVDSLMNGNLKEFRKFCEGLVERKLGITWWGYARCDGRMDLEFYKVMRASGAQGFNYGIESGSDKVLKAVNKKITVAEVNQNIIDSHSVGLKVNACWVIGAPGEDIEAFTHSFNMLWNHRARIIAVSPGPGLGDTAGSDYDNREKYNLNPRDKQWLNGWYTLDLMNTKLHRYIRVKLMHIWLYVCKEYGGTLTNIHSVGDITQHFEVTYDSEYINDQLEYEDFDYNIIKSDQGDFANSVMNEVFGFLRLLWRARGGYEITLTFSPELDNTDFIFVTEPHQYSYNARVWFKIDDAGNYQTTSNFKFDNYKKEIVSLTGFEYSYNAVGQWKESKKTVQKKVFHIKVAPEDRVEVPLAGCFSGIALNQTHKLSAIAKALTDNSIIVEVGSELGGKAATLAHSNRNITIHSIENFSQGSLFEKYGYMRPYLGQHLGYVYEQAGLSRSLGDELVNEIDKDFETDPSGKLVWERNTKKYPNIILHEDYNAFANWNTEIDVCLLNCYQNPEMYDNITFWANHVKQNGYIIAQPYHEKHPDVISEIDYLISKGWTTVSNEEGMIIIKKS